MDNEILERLASTLTLELPSEAQNKIIVLFADGDSTNWSILNLAYCFKDGPVECPFYRGYYYIPGFSRCVINREGDLIIVRTGRVKKWCKSKSVKSRNITGGYMVSWAIDDTGVRRGISRHRALCLTFKHPGIHPGELWVNHRDGIPGHDDLDNIEFCTPGGNVKHAYDTGLYPSRTVAVDAINWITGKDYHFSSIAECCSTLGLSEQLVSGRLRAPNRRRHVDGWRFKRATEEWLSLDSRINERDEDVEVIGREIFSDKISIFPTVAEAARITGVEYGTIQTHITVEPETPVYGWNFRRLDRFVDWPVYSEKHLAIFRDRPVKAGDGIEVLDCDTNEMLFFTSAEEAGKHFGISPITASKLARYEQTRQKRYKFKLFRVKQVS
jgi:hypothetical protein